MRAFDYLKTEHGFNHVANLIKAPLDNLSAESRRVMPALIGSGAIKLAFYEARKEWATIHLPDADIIRAVNAIDIFIGIKSEDLPMYLATASDVALELVNLRLSEGLDA